MRNATRVKRDGRLGLGLRIERDEGNGARYREMARKLGIATESFDPKAVGGCFSALLNVSVLLAHF